MIFGSINYLNLLPFQIFLKKYIKHNATKMAINYKKNVPSKINHLLKIKKIHAGFISSIYSKNHKCTKLGIVANQVVYSVFIIENRENKIDIESATSNKLASILKLKGEVIIGDKALKFYLDGGNGIDLATKWYEKTKLPMVFARLCFNKHKKYIERIESSFSRKKIKIPQYILKKEAKKRNISTKDLLWYLNHIDYKLDYKAKKSLNLFLKKAK